MNETPEVAAQKIAEIRGNPEHPFNVNPLFGDGRDAHAAACAEVIRLTGLVTDGRRGAAPAGPSAEQTQAQERLDAIRGDREHVFHKPGHPRHLAAINEVIRLTELANPAPAPSSPTLPWDVPRPPAPEPSIWVETPPMRAALPELDGGRAWDEPMLTELATVAEQSGMTAAVPGIMHVLVAAERGRRYSEEEHLAELDRRYGEVEADALVADASAAAALLPEKLKAWLLDSGLHTHPDVTSAVARSWRRRKGAPA